jgi:type IV pilus assembly protein PilN
MIHINLLPVRAAQKQARFQREVFVFCSVIFFAIICCSVVYVNLKLHIAKTTKAIATSNQEIAKLKTVLGEVNEFKKKQKDYQDKLDVIADLKRKKSGPIHLLDDLNKVLPEKLWLETFQETAGIIKITGIGVSQKTVADFITELEKSPYYRDVDLRLTKQVLQDGVKLQSFKVDCKSESSQSNDSKNKGSKI